MRTHRGFTLIEVLVVVAIIALLATILMPALKEARRVSKRTACLSNLEQIRIAMQAYIQSNKDCFPMVAQYPLKEEQIAQAENRIPYPSLPAALQREMGGNSQAFECPADQIPIEEIKSDPEIAAGGWRRYYDMQKTSYEFLPWLCGRKLHPRTMQLLSEQLVAPLKDIPLVYDVAVFHGEPDKLRTHNAMWANFEVRSDQKKNTPAGP